MKQIVVVLRILYFLQADSMHSKRRSILDIVERARYGSVADLVFSYVDAMPRKRCSMFDAVGVAKCGSQARFIPRSGGLQCLSSDARPGALVRGSRTMPVALGFG